MYFPRLYSTTLYMSYTGTTNTGVSEPPPPAAHTAAAAVNNAADTIKSNGSTVWWQF